MFRSRSANASTTKIVPSVEKTEKRVDGIAHFGELDPGVAIVFDDAASPSHFIVGQGDESL